MNTSAPRRWRLCMEREFDLRKWGHEAVVYDISSGDTHLLSSAAADVLTQLRTGPATLGELAAGMLSFDQNAHQADPARALAATLTHLGKLGLIEPEQH